MGRRGRKGERRGEGGWEGVSRREWESQRSVGKTGVMGIKRVKEEGGSKKVQLVGIRMGYWEKV